MKRIGIAASKMAKQSLVLYNCYVILITFLCSLLLFVIAGATVLFALVILIYVSKEVMAVEFEKSWTSILAVCMGTLTIVMALFSLIAILQNIKLKVPKEEG